MIKVFLFFSTLFFSLAQATDVLDEKVKFIQPNGSVFYAYWRGDDVFRYIESASGLILIKDLETGRYEYATFYNVTDNPMLIPSGMSYKPEGKSTLYRAFGSPKVNVWPKDIEEIRDFLQ